MLETTILTLPFDPLIEGFANERVSDFSHDRELVSVDSFASFAFTHTRLAVQLVAAAEAPEPAPPGR